MAKRDDYSVYAGGDSKGMDEGAITTPELSSTGTVLSAIITPQAAAGTDQPGALIVAQANSGNQQTQGETFDLENAEVKATFTSTEVGTPITLPPGTTFDKVFIKDGNLYLVQPDGSVVVINGGAVFFPTLVLAPGFTISSTQLADALSNAQEGVPTAGPDTVGPGSSGGDFAVNPGAIGGPFDLFDLLPPNFLQFVLFQNEFETIELAEELGGGLLAPTIGTPDRGAVEEDDLPGGSIVTVAPTVQAINSNSFFYCDAVGNDLYPDMSFGNALSTTGNLDVTGASSVFFTDLGTTSIPYQLSDGTPVTSGGKTVYISRVDLFGSPDTTQIVGFVDGVGGITGEYDSADQVVFNVYITPDGSGGFQYTLDIYCSLDHGEMTINGQDGDTVTIQGENSEELLPLDFNFTAIGPGGSATGSFVVDWQDDIPAIGDGEFLPNRPEFARVDEDDLVDGNDDDEPGDDDTLTNTSIDTDADPSTVSGSLGIYWGADHHNDNSGNIPGDRMVILTGLTVQDQNFNVIYDGTTVNNLKAIVPSAGAGSPLEQVTVSVAITTDSNQQSVLTGTATATNGTVYTIFVVTTSDVGFGSYTFALDPNQDGVSLVHPYTDSDRNNDGQDSNGNPQTAYEDDLYFNVDFSAKDSDGDIATSVFTVLVDDDVPVVVSRATVMGVVEEEHLDSSTMNTPPHLSFGNEDNFSGDGSDPDNDLDLDTIAPDDFSLTTNSFSGSGATSLATLVDFGADGPNFMLKDATAFTDPALKDVNGNTVTSYGQDVIFTNYITNVSGQTTLVAKANAAVAGTIMVSGTTTLAELGFSGSPALFQIGNILPGSFTGLGTSFGETNTINDIISFFNSTFTVNSVDITLELTDLGTLLVHGTDLGIQFDLQGGGWSVLGLSNGTYAARTVFDLTVEQDGDWTANIYDQFDHHPQLQADDMEDILELELSGLVLAADGDDDSVMLNDDTFTLKVIDDIPVRISPEQATLENDGMSGTPSSFTGALDFFHNMGADEAGKVVFVDLNATDDFLRDTGGNFVTVGGDNIILTGFGTTVLEGYVDTSGDGVIDSGEPLALRITLNPDAVTQANDTYTVDLFAELDNSSGATSSNVVDSLTNSARTYKGADNVLGDIDVLFSANDETGARADVNKSNGGAVGAGSQGTGADQILRMDFTQGLVVNEASASGETFSYTGHALVNNVSFAINQITPTNNDVNMIIRIYDADDEAGTIGENDISWHAPADAGDLIVDISQIIINDGVATPGVTVVIDGSGDFATITGLSVGDKIEVVGVSDYDRIEIQNADDSSVPSNNTKFDIENIRFETTGAASPIVFDADLEVFDQDGDSVLAQLPIEVSPDLSADITFKIEVMSEGQLNDTSTQLASVQEGDTADDSAGFAITLGGDPLPAGNSASVIVSVDGASTATGGDDFTPTVFDAIANAAAGLPGVSFDTNTGELTFEGGGTTVLDFFLNIQDDGDIEGLENLIINLSSATVQTGSASIVAGQQTAQLDIIDNDVVPLPTILTVDNQSSAPTQNYLIEGSNPFVRSNPATTLSRVQFQDPGGNAVVQVSFASANTSDVWVANSFAGVSVVSNMNGIIVLEGLISNLNDFLREEGLLWNPGGTGNNSASAPADRTITIGIDNDPLANDGNETTTTLTLDFGDPGGTRNVGNWNFFNSILNPNTDTTGTDPVVTSWSHSNGIGLPVTTYIANENTFPDTVVLVFTPDQLEEILTVSGDLAALDAFLDTNAGVENLDLSGTSWNAAVQNFEFGLLGLAGGVDEVVVYQPATSTTGLPNSTTASAGRDLLIGAGTNSNIGGQGGDDIILGRAGNDTLQGNSGNDLILGGDGMDTIIGGIDDDILSGGRDADTFVMDNTSSIDTILDYSFVDGDVIDLSALLDAAFGPGDNRDDFAQLQESGDNVLVQVDTNGTTGGANFTTVAILSGYSTGGSDPVAIAFEGQTTTEVI